MESEESILDFLWKAGIPKLTFFSYVLLGLSLAVPVGTLTIEMVKRGIRFGFFHSWVVGIGGMVADLILMTLIYAGVAQFLVTETAKLFLWSFGFITLLYIGYESIRDSSQTVLISSFQEEPLWKSFMTGFTITLANPINIIFWIGIYGSVLASAMTKVSFQQSLLYSSAIFLGVALWDLFVSGVVHFSRQAMNATFVRILSIAAGCFLIGFGFYFGYQVIQALFV